MAFPVRTVSRPAALTGQTNGMLSASILSSVPGQAGGLDVLLVRPAARAWRALAAAALDAGHVLKLSGGGCAYRSYAIQERIFRDRYTTTYLPDRPYKTWNGRRWYQRPGTAVAAVPGTSNHGWGLAVDVGEERDGDSSTESLDTETLGWLLANEERFGWSHELQSEPWHLRYFAGDRIPQAVLDFEGSPQEEDDMYGPAERDELVKRLDELRTESDANWSRLVGLEAFAAWAGPVLAEIAGRDGVDVDEAEIARQVLAGLDNVDLSDEQVRSIIDAIPGQVKKALREGAGG